MEYDRKHNFFSQISGDRDPFCQQRSAEIFHGESSKCHRININAYFLLDRFVEHTPVALHNTGVVMTAIMSVLRSRGQNSKKERVLHRTRRKNEKKPKKG